MAGKRVCRGRDALTKSFSSGEVFSRCLGEGRSEVFCVIKATANGDFFEVSLTNHTTHFPSSEGAKSVARIWFRGGGASTSRGAHLIFASDPKSQGSPGNFRVPRIRAPLPPGYALAR